MVLERAVTLRHAERLVASLGPDDGDGTRRLSVKVVFEDFAGSADAWVDNSMVQNFAARLGEYPLGDSHAPHFSAGYGYLVEGRAEDERIGFHASQIDDVGHIVVTVHLAQTADIRQPQDLHDVVVQFATGYQQLGEFSAALAAAAANREPGTASLRAAR